MSIKKLFDAVILIRLLEEIEGIDIFYAWHNDTRYELWTTPEVIFEVKTEAKEGLTELIEAGIIQVFSRSPKTDLIEIQNEAPRLSLTDCSLFYHCHRMKNIVCLSDDNPLRKHFKRNRLDLHGTMGIYQKLKMEQTFSLQKIEKMFKEIISDPRIFPSS
ncbi:MAG: hypothetical protein ACOC35_09475 [Promethearchaeia archaeon]